MGDFYIQSNFQGLFQLQEIKLLPAIDGESLLDFDVEPPRFIIARFLPIGLHILSGSVKIGKGIAESTNIREYRVGVQPKEKILKVLSSLLVGRSRL